MIRVIIIDDEKSSQVTLSNMLTDFCEGVEVIGITNAVLEGVGLITSLKPDLVFLDIEMPIHNGFKLFEYFPRPNFQVVFTTAYQQYAIKAFRFSAVDYLLKPIDLNELRDAIKKVTDRKDVDLTVNKLSILQEHLNNKGQKLSLPATDGYHFVKIEDVIRCESKNNYTLFYLRNDKKVLVSKTLKVFSKMLEDLNFFRVSRSDLVNMHHVEKINRHKSPSVIMSDGSMISISLRRKEEFLQTIKGIF